MTYRVTKELLLHITEFCDRKTLLALLQSNQEIHSLIKEYEHSISAAKLKNFLLPPQTHLLTSKDEQRRAIPNKNSFATVQELELRESRFRSILDNGGFLSTSCPETLGFTNQSLDKHKRGLKRAMYIADRLADVEADPEIKNARREIVDRVKSIEFDNTSDEDVAAQRDAEWQGYVEFVKALRARQAKVLHDCSTLDLAFLFTLCEGAIVGWQRYMAKYASSDVRFYHKMDAFGELVLRKGCFTIWAFVRGTGDVLASLNQSVTSVAENIWHFEMSFDQADPGLTMALHKELRRRLRRATQEGDTCFGVTELEGLMGTSLEDPEEDPLENPSPLLVKQWAHKLVGADIGYKEWKGYHAVDHPQ